LRFEKILITGGAVKLLLASGGDLKLKREALMVKIEEAKIAYGIDFSTKIRQKRSKYLNASFLNQ